MNYSREQQQIMIGGQIFDVYQIEVTHGEPIQSVYHGSLHLRGWTPKAITIKAVSVADNSEIKISGTAAALKTFITPNEVLRGLFNEK